jgi:hypothetical protein
VCTITQIDDLREEFVRDYVFPMFRYEPQQGASMLLCMFVRSPALQACLTVPDDVELAQQVLVCTSLPAPSIDKCAI